MELIAEIRHRVLTGEISIRQAASLYRLNFRTIQRIVLGHQEAHSEQPAARVKPVLGPFLDIIRQILSDDLNAPPKQQHTARRIYDRLVKDHHFAGGLSTIRAAVARLRPQCAEVFVPLDHPPAHAQCDFGHANVVVAGVQHKAALFVLTLVHSNQRFACLVPRETTETFLLGHAAAFDTLGGVPLRITYDNSRIAVAAILGAHDRKTTEAFNRLRGHFCFTAHFCNVRRGNEKGSVENAVGYVRRNFLVPVAQADSWEQLNQRLTSDCQRDFDEQARRCGERLVRRDADRAALLPLPADPYPSGRVEVLTVNKMSLVRFERNDYSAPSHLAYQSLTALGGLDHVTLMHHGQVVARHPRHWGSGQTSLDPLHYLGVLERKPGTLDHGLPFAHWDLPKCFAQIRLRLESRDARGGTKQYIRVLLLLRQHDLHRLAEAIERALLLPACDVAVIRTLLEPLEQAASFDLSGRPQLNSVSLPSPDLSAYATLLGSAEGRKEGDWQCDDTE